MLLPIKPICPSNKTRSDGTAIIFFQYCYSPTNRTLLNTGIAIPCGYWNKKQQCISDKLPLIYGNYAILNEQLKKQFRIVEDLVMHANKSGILNKGAFVKKTFTPSLDTTSIVGQVTQTILEEVKEKKSKLDIYY